MRRLKKRIKALEDRMYELEQALKGRQVFCNMAPVALASGESIRPGPMTGHFAEDGTLTLQ